MTTTLTPEAMRIALAKEIGWTPDIDIGAGYWIPPGERKLKAGYYTAKPPNYGTDANAALEIVEMMRERGYWGYATFRPDRTVRFDFMNGTRIHETAFGDAQTLPLAICEAACRALGIS